MSLFPMSESDARILFGNKPRASGSPRAKKKKEDLPENQLERQIADFLRYRGWIVYRHQVGTYVPYRIHRLVVEGKLPAGAAHPIRIGEEGESDFVAVRAVPKAPTRPEMFYYEAKAPGKEPSEKQRLWLEQRSACGLLAAYFDDFDNKFDTSFVPWYMRWFPDR